MTTVPTRLSPRRRRQGIVKVVGTTLGHYEILEPLGAGGMGEVYRARDTKLDRDVAIKVLPEDFATDPDRLARFEREAKLLASLNHANIAAIYGLEDEADQRFIAMELVEGQTLAERIVKSGRIEVTEALELARQIAEALEAAHDNGVIHRDLKPANVIVTPEGKVKVLDFGLAKAYEADGSAAEISPNLSHSPTMAEATLTGMILGTAAYMSPEQARGKPVDKRTDIWAFGCVLFEMLSGRRAFHGETVSDTMAAILKEEPDWATLPATAPADIHRVMRRCLAKDPMRRLRDIGDARWEIEEARARPDAEAPSLPPVPAWRRTLPWALAAVMAVAAFALWLRAPSDPLRPYHLHFVLPPGVLLAVDTEHPVLALSPDGTRLVFVGEEDGVRRLYIRVLAESETRAMEGTEEAASPFFSPDGDWIGFLTFMSLKKVPVEGGAPVAVHHYPGTFVSRGFTWNTADTVVQSLSVNNGLYLGSVAGDAIRPFDEWEPITELGSPTAWPYALPGGRRVLFVDGNQESPEGTRIAVLDLETRQSVPLFPGGTNPRYSPTGHLLYARSGSLYAASFDPVRDESVGAERKLLDGVMTATNGAAQFAVAAGGTLAYVTGGAELGDHELVWVGRDGRPEAISDGPLFSVPRLSADGTRLLVTRTTLARTSGLFGGRRTKTASPLPRRSRRVRVMRARPSPGCPA